MTVDAVYIIIFAIIIFLAIVVVTLLVLYKCTRRREYIPEAYSTDRYFEPSLFTRKNYVYYS